MLFFKILKRCRVALSLLVFAGITYYFAVVWIHATHFLAPLLKLQFIPSLLGLMTGSLWVCVALLLLTALFGRFYCSLLCPMGTLQDISIRIARLFKSKKRRHFHYARPHQMVRYSILATVSACWIAGLSFPLLLLDPYSNFGRFATHLLGPVMHGLNNLASYRLPDTFYYVSFSPVSLWIYVLLIAVFLIIVGLSAFKGRLFCNTLCPVGSFLGIISKYAAFRPVVQKSACNHCGVCALKCKASCINTKEQTVDYSRCVACVNCILSCKQGAMVYTFCWGKKRGESPTKEVLDKTRRTFLASAGGVVGATAIYRVVNGNSLVFNSAQNTISPPGARSHAHLKQFCTACQACVAACPMRIIKPTLTGYGLDGLMIPALSFDKGFCSYDCNRCAQVCPSGAIEAITIEEKKLIQIGKADFKPRLCVVTIDRTDCGACDEHCPTKAVRMVPFGDGKLRRPMVDRDRCIGCGACESICPATPKAITVVAQSVHTTALPPTVEKQEQVVVDDFGF